MADPIEPLIVDFIEWIGAEPRPYVEVMDAWRTSCPRLTVWEEAVDRGLVARRREMAETLVDLTPLGRAFLEEAGRAGA